ncbi:MAG: hypothetical protein JWL95_2267 [Gemmatimonadetes bacterium]|nr:hypothetical protein [Gemmatimonadota bacterium]
MLSFSSMRRAFVPLLAVMLVPAAAHAQESQLFSWSGRVDREVRLTIRGSQASNTYENSIQSRARFRVNSALPAQDGSVRVVREAGRGDVQVIQEPSSQNGYTAIIQITDNEGGADNYRISAYYVPSNNGYGRNGNRGRGQGRDGQYDNRGGGRNNNVDAAALRWSGDVDGEVLLTWRGNDVGQRIINGAQVRRVSSNVLGNPMQAARGGQLAVSTREGRGRIEVVQQPTAQNRYTSIIRIIDPERGYGHYDFTASLR